MAKIEPHPEAFSRPRQRRPRKHGANHLAWIRSLPSLKSGKRGCQACHIRYGSRMHGKRETGMAEKPDDHWTVPLTPDEHHDQHSGSERAWWAALGIDPLDVAARLWVSSGDDEAGEFIIRYARLQARPQ